jgi:AcrR family transcriptional regulator
VTEPDRPPRSRRDRPAKAPLSRDAIVQAALAILRSDGLGALSMRRVATALDTGAGSLYVYVDGRDALLEALFDHIVGTVTLPSPDPAGWREQVHSLLAGLRDALIEHPGIAAAAMVDPPRTEVSMRLLENLLGLLLAGGIGDQDAAWTADILSAQVTYAAIEAELRRTEPDAIAAEVSTTLATLPPAEFPVITSHAAALVAGDVEHRFRYAIDVVLDGVLARTPS